MTIGNMEVQRMFWKRKNKDEEKSTLDKLLPILKIVESEISSLKARADAMETRFRNKVFGKKKEEDLEEKTESDIKDDGFNELRKLRKSGII